MFKKIYNAVKNVKSIEELKSVIENFRKKEDINPLYFCDDKFPFSSLVERYAFEGNEEKVAWLLTLGAHSCEAIYGYCRANNYIKIQDFLSSDECTRLINEIGYGYASVGNHKEVEKLEKYLADLIANNDIDKQKVNYLKDYIGEGYALGGYDDQVESYKKQGASISRIVEGYANAGRKSKVEECIKLGGERADTATYIPYQYAKGGHHSLAFEFAKENNGGILIVALSAGYDRVGNYKKAEEYRVINRLGNCGEAGEKLITIIERLQKGEQNKSNPYWANSGKKLSRIINELKEDYKNLHNEKALLVLLKNPNSTLNHALNSSRILPFTFLGQLSAKSKSLLAIEEVVNAKPKM